MFTDEEDEECSSVCGTCKGTGLNPAFDYDGMGLGCPDCDPEGYDDD